MRELPIDIQKSEEVSLVPPTAAVSYCSNGSSAALRLYYRHRCVIRLLAIVSASIALLFGVSFITIEIQNGSNHVTHHNPCTHRGYKTDQESVQTPLTDDLSLNDELMETLNVPNTKRVYTQTPSTDEVNSNNVPHSHNRLCFMNVSDNINISISIPRTVNADIVDVLNFMLKEAGLKNCFSIQPTLPVSHLFSMDMCRIGYKKFSNVILSERDTRLEQAIIKLAKVFTC